jgi:hypothetical protein
MKIHFHSITDLITNSSTVIYTYSGASVQACKDMVDEIFNSLGVDKKCDDVFILTVLSDDDVYEEWIDNNEDDEEDDEEDDGEDEEDDGEDDGTDEIEDNACGVGINIKELTNDIIHGRAEKPEWMKSAEDNNCDGYPNDTTLHIVAKDPKFEKLAKLVVDFLYSTDHEATRDG